MAAEPNQDARIPGVIQFIQHFLPPLDAGDYTLTVSQSISVQETDPTSGSKTTRTPAIEAVTHRFLVAGERFAIAANEVPRQFPPADSIGEYMQVLPHIVFTRRTLPWTRSPDSSGAPPSADANGDVPAWLALFVLDESEVRAIGRPQADGAVKLPTSDGTLADLIPHDRADLPGGNQPSDTLSLFTKAAGAGLETGESLSDPVRYIDLPTTLFSAIAPSENDLRYLAHARRVQIPAQSHPAGAQAKAAAKRAARDSDSPPAATDAPVDNVYAVVVANRLPAPGAKSTALLVSLERLGRFLPNDDGDPSADLEDYTTVRLPVLRPPWRFTDTGVSVTFKTILQQINHDNSDDSLLRLPAAGSPPPGSPAAYAQQALQAGYTAVDHTTRDGQQTVSWYRGPFTPYPVPFSLSADDSDTLPLPFFSADAATGYNPETGMLDLSYSAAWQLGRLLALHNRHFATELYYWKHDQKQRRLTNYERWRLADAHGLETGDGTSAAQEMRPQLQSLIQQLLADHPLATNAGA